MAYSMPKLSCRLSEKVLYAAVVALVYVHTRLLTASTFAGTLRKLYRTAMQMEVDFFSAQPGTGPPPAIRMLVVDFDDTCTATDTTSQVFNTATSATVESSAGQMQFVWQSPYHLTIPRWHAKL